MSKLADNQKRFDSIVKKYGDNAKRATKELRKFENKIREKNDIVLSLSKDRLSEVAISLDKMKEEKVLLTAQEVMESLGLNILACDKEFDEVGAVYIDIDKGLASDKSTVCYLTNSSITYLPSYVKKVKIDSMSRLHWAMAGVNIED